MPRKLSFFTEEAMHECKRVYQLFEQGLGCDAQALRFCDYEVAHTVLGLKSVYKRGEPQPKYKPMEPVGMFEPITIYMHKTDVRLAMRVWKICIKYRAAISKWEGRGIRIIFPDGKYLWRPETMAWERRDNGIFDELELLDYGSSLPL